MEYYTTREKKPADYCKTIDLSKCEDMLAPIPTNNRMHVIKLIIRKSDDRVREVGLVGGEKLVLTSQVHKDRVLNRKW